MKKRGLLKKATALAIATLMATAIMMGCGSGTSESSATTSDAGTKTSASASTETSASSETTVEKTVVKVGFGTGYAPFVYLDENEKPAGYDYDCFMAVAEKLSDKYVFDLTPDAFANLLIGIDTGIYDMTVSHWGYTEARAEKYLYATEGDMYINYFMVGYAPGREGITDLASCAGLTAVAQSGTKADNMLANWNAEHPDLAVEVANVEDLSIAASGLASGLYDFYLASTYDMQTFNNNYGSTITLEYSDDVADYVEIPNPGIYYIYAKGMDPVQQDVDQAIRELREEGVLSELCIKWLGSDWTQPIAK